MRQLISGLFIGLMAIVAGFVLFRLRYAIVRYNVEQRRGMMGRFLTEGMRGGDRVAFPLLAFLLCLFGVGMIAFTLVSALSGRLH